MTPGRVLAAARVFLGASLSGPAGADGQEQEATNYSGSDDVTTAWLDSGHFPELEGCAAEFRALYAHWVHERWDVGMDVPAPAVGAEECVTEVRVKGA